MPINAIRLIRKMRGGAQAHLLQCDDGHFYVVKFRNNPQHRRILVNEWLASAFLQYRDLDAASRTGQFVRGVSRKQSRRAYPAWVAARRCGLRLALWIALSRRPGKGDRIRFHPDLLLDRVANRDEFLGVLAFDKWIGNADARQSIFFRARLQPWPSPKRTQGQRLGFVASMMDHGYIFDGPHWTFSDSPLQGLYFRPSVYRSAKSFDDFQPWLDRITHLPEDVIDRAQKQIPPEWLEGDEPAFEVLLNRLMARRKRVPELIEDSRRGRVNPFPDWKKR